MVGKRAVQRAAADALAQAVRTYVNERENPAPDPTMRHIDYEAMKASLIVYEWSTTRRSWVKARGARAEVID